MSAHRSEPTEQQREAAEAEGIPTSEPCVPDGFHCWHWSYTPKPCCHCGSEEDDEDSRCHNRATAAVTVVPDPWAPEGGYPAVDLF